MDWRAVAGLLAERSDRPVALLDGAGRFQLMNAAMEMMLGRRSDEVAGRSLVDEIAPADCAQSLRQWLKSALSGARTKSEIEMLTRDGRRVLLSLESALVGRRRDQGLFVTVASVRPVEGPEIASRDIDYEITTAPNDFGKLQRIAGVGSLIEGATGQRCFELLHERDAPCEDCPILSGGDDAWPRTAVRRRAGTFELVTAQREGTRTVLSVRLVRDPSLAAIQRARIGAIADKARLSEREREILRQLLDGRSLDDIASALQLSRRTVKFHQANVLQKLGVDSRVDLIRITAF